MKLVRVLKRSMEVLSHLPASGEYQGPLEGVYLGGVFE